MICFSRGLIANDLLQWGLIPCRCRYPVVVILMAKALYQSLDFGGLLALYCCKPIEGMLIAALSVESKPGGGRRFAGTVVQAIPPAVTALYWMKTPYVRFPENNNKSRKNGAKTWLNVM